jgi:hypothetical protein
MRIYPFSLRVTSSNLDPSFFWRRGAQIVALNWQNLDKGTMLNRAMFEGEQGWVRKPLGYRPSDAGSPVRRTLDLSIEVLAAQGLPLPPGDTHVRGFSPYVVAYLHVEQPGDGTQTPHEDDSSDSKASSYKRATKTSSGTDPDFGAQMVRFPTVFGIVEELSFVRFVIEHFFLVFPFAIACISMLSLMLFSFSTNRLPGSKSKTTSWAAIHSRLGPASSWTVCKKAIV